MSLRRAATSLAVLGLLLVPAPAYLPAFAAFADGSPDRTSQVFAARPIDPTTVAGERVILDRHAGRITFDLHALSAPGADRRYRAPNATREVLRAAVRDGTATTDRAAVRADLRAIARNNTFVLTRAHDGDRYLRLSVREDGSVVRLANVSAARVANVTVQRVTLEYESFSAEERETFDRILANSTHSWGHRPPVDAALVDRLPALVRRDGRLYSVHVTAHVDDLGPGFGAFFAGLYVAAAGVGLLAIGGAGRLYARRRD